MSFLIGGLITKVFGPRENTVRYPPGRPVLFPWNLRSMFLRLSLTVTDNTVVQSSTFSTISLY